MLKIDKNHRHGDKNLTRERIFAYFRPLINVRFGGDVCEIDVSLLNLNSVVWSNYCTVVILSVSPGSY